ncbi:MAG: YhgE/Pip domain-containing protein [bacterium]|nr:YhgE/Pip domain-containing protein [bacterium]
MLKREWQSLFKNKFLCIVLIGIITIPTIYTTIFLGSMWDPYGEISNLPVAVVNKDKSVDYDGKTMDVGNNLVDNLKDNDSLAFNFVTEEQAEKGLEDGTYYMVITIPENFSENATTLMDESPKTMELEYKTNPGTNYIASKMSDTAISKIRTSVAEEVTKQYAETVFDQLGEIGDGFTEATDGTEKLGDGLEKLSDGNGKISENLTTLSDSSLTFKDGANDFQVALKTYTDGVATANGGAGQLKDGIDTLAGGTGALADGASQLSDGSVTLKNGLDTLAGGAGALADGAAQLNTGASALKVGINTLAGGAGTLADGATKLNNGSSELKNGVSTYTGGVSQVYAGTQQLVANNKALNDGVGTLSTGITTLKSGSGSLLAGLNTMSDSLKTSLSADKKKDLAELKAGIPQVKQGLNALNDGISSVDVKELPKLIGTVKTGMTSVGTDVSNAGKHVATAQAKKKAARDEIKSNAGFQSLSKEDQAAILGAFDTTDDELEDAMTDIKSSGKTLAGLQDGLQGSGLTNEKLEQIATLQQSVQELTTGGNKVLDGSLEAVTSLQTGLETIQDALDRKGTTPATMGLIQGMTAVNDGVGQLDTGVNSKDGLKASVKTYTTGVETVNDGLKTLNDNSTTLNSGAIQLSDGLSELNDKVPTLTGGIEKLQGGATQLSDGLSELNSKVPTLTGGISKLQAGAGQLSTGLTALNEKVPTLTAGISKLQDGATQLAAGTTKLTANNAKVMEAIATLADGSGKISDGSSKLADASNTLGEGLTTAKDGVTELNEKLGDAAKEINEKKTTEDNYQMFATPVETSGSEMTSVDNNGNAMAAYMMSVALWVGCLAFSIMYPLSGSAGEVKSGFRWWLSKASVASLIAGLQAIVMVFMLKGVLGFNPAYFGKTLVIAILASFAFMTIFYFGNLLMGKIGSFLLLIFMVLQLGGSAGTYPIELSGDFYKAIHPFMPFTYSVNAFRATIATGASIAQPITVFVSIIIGCTGLTILLFQFKAKRAMGQTSVEAIDPLLGEMAE